MLRLGYKCCWEVISRCLFDLDQSIRTRLNATGSKLNCLDEFRFDMEFEVRYFCIGILYGVYRITQNHLFNISILIVIEIVVVDIIRVG